MLFLTISSFFIVTARFKCKSIPGQPPPVKTSNRVRILSSPVKAILGYSGTIIACPARETNVGEDICVVPDLLDHVLSYVKLRKDEVTRVDRNGDFFTDEEIERHTKEAEQHLSEPYNYKIPQRLAIDYGVSKATYETEVKCKVDDKCIPIEVGQTKRGCNQCQSGNDCGLLGSRVRFHRRASDEDCIDGTITGEEEIDEGTGGTDVDKVMYYVIAYIDGSEVKYEKLQRESFILRDTTAKEAEFIGAVVELHGVLKRRANVKGYDSTTQLYSLKSESLAERFGATGGLIDWDTSKPLSDFHIVNDVETLRELGRVAKVTGIVTNALDRVIGLRDKVIREPVIDETRVPEFDCFTQEYEHKAQTIDIIYKVDELIKADMKVRKSVINELDTDIKSLEDALAAINAG